MRSLVGFLALSCLVLVSSAPARHHFPVHQQPHHESPSVHKQIGFEDVYLVNGIPTNGYGRNNGSWVYYIFNIPTATRAPVQASVTPLFGTPALYISCDNRPTLTNYTWMAGASSDAAVILVTIQELDASCASGHMYIGVYTNAPSDFMVESNTVDVLIQLQDGVAQSGVAGPGATFYKYAITGNLTDTTDTLITITPITGIPSLYINCGTIPSPTTYRWKSDSNTGLQEIRIAPADLCTDQQLWIGIFSLPTTIDPSSFDIIVTSGAVATELQSGKTIRGGGLANEYSNYIFNFQPGQSLSIEATVIYGDIITIYASCYVAPDANSFTWKADVVDSGSVELAIASVDNHYCNNGYIYISTVSKNIHAFAIVAHTTSDVIEIVNGIPIYDRLDVGQFNYYSIAIPTNAINTAITFLHGDGVVYVSCNNTQPGPNSNDATGDFLQLSRLSCPILYIGITATQQTSYLFIAYHPTSTVQLLNDVKQHDMIPASTTVYYQLTMGSKVDVAISVLSVSTHPELVYQFFVSCTQQHPSKSLNTWSSPGGNNPNQQILISSSDPNACTQYYIAVITDINNRYPLEVIISGFGK